MTSLLQLLSQFGHILQSRLFPALREELEGVTEQHEMLVQTLAMLQLDAFVAARCGPGRPARSRANILRALVAKAVFGIAHTRALIERLESDIAMRRICGWERADQVPDESVFSRAFSEFASSELPQRIHAALIQRSYADHLVGHISRDSSAIPVREKAPPKPKTPQKRASRRKGGAPKKPEEMTRLQRQSRPEATLEEMLGELPRVCDKGCKKDSTGKPQFWVGYKLHLDVADGQVPISGLLTSASLHDSQAAIPLALISARRVTSLYDLMDSGYDAQQIRDFSQRLGHVPIIDRQKRGADEKPEMAPHEKARFRERTAVERVYSRLKEEFGGRFIRVRGCAKIMAHLMFGVLALTVDQLLRLAADLDASPGSS